MRKRIFGRRLKRDKNARRALFRSLMRAFFLHGRIQTTEAKAKAIKGRLEKFVTKAKRRGETARGELLKSFDKDIVDKLITEIAPRFESRPGGYTRFVKLGGRVKDNASMVLLEWVEGDIKDTFKEAKGVSNVVLSKTKKLEAVVDKEKEATKKIKGKKGAKKYAENNKANKTK